MELGSVIYKWAFIACQILYVASDSIDLVYRSFFSRGMLQIKLIFDEKEESNIVL